MPRSRRHDVTLHNARQPHVADYVQNFVADKFVGIIEFVEPARVVVDDDVFNRAAQAQTHCPQRVNFFFVGDCSRGRNFSLVNVFGYFKVGVLNSNQRVRIDRDETDAEAVVGHGHDESLALRAVHAINFFHANNFSLGVLFGETRRANHLEEVNRVAAEHGRLLRRNFNLAVVHAANVERAHQVFDCKNFCAVLFQSRRPKCRRHVGSRRMNFWSLRQIRPQKNYSAVDLGGLEFQAHFFARMQPDADAGNFAPQCPLSEQDFASLRKNSCTLYHQRFLTSIKFFVEFNFVRALKNF